MAIGQDSNLLGSVHTLFGVGAIGTLTDAQLLDRFLDRRDPVAEVAFETLVARHGSMVLEVCRNVLGDPHEAQDAFQATFLVFARKAGSIRNRDSVGSWLHGVARRVASKARRDAARRRVSEQRATTISAVDSPPSGERADYSALHEEIGRLPERYRAPVVLCYLEGMTHDQASGHLRCTVSTVGVRLMRARQRLRSRLIRRGVALTSVLVAGGAVAKAASVVLPPALVESTARAAMRTTTGKAVAIGSPSVTSLAEGTLRTMMMTKLKLATLAILSAGLVVTGGGRLVRQVSAQRGGEPVTQVAQANTPVVQKEPRPPTPKEQFEALLAKYDAPRSQYINDEPRAQVAAAGFLRLAREHPRDPVAIDALAWVVGHALFTPAAGEAMGLLTHDHIRSERLGSLAREQSKLYGGPFEPLERFFREVLACSPLREVRGSACLGLADYLRKKTEDIDRRRQEYELFRRSPNDVPFTSQPEVKEGEVERLTGESAGYYERVIEEFEDIKADMVGNNGGGVGKSLGESARSGLYALKHLSIGDVAPEIEGRDIDGGRFKLGDYLGQVVVLTFSGNWCGPCRGMYPEDRELVERLKDGRFALLSVNTDEESRTLRESIEKGEITWRCWWDGGIGPITRRWNIECFPTVFVIDHEGTIRYKNPSDLRTAVESLLEKIPKAEVDKPNPSTPDQPRSVDSPSSQPRH